MKQKFIFPVLCALMMCFVACNENGPTRSMKGKFSVSRTKQVTFSPGNLQYQASTNTWRFAENQHDFIGKDNEKVSDSYDGWIDLFGWGTGDNPTKTSIDGYENFVDWGTNQIGSCAPNTWRTLSRDEWVYLLELRDGFSDLISRLVETSDEAGICTAEWGLVLLPDGTELSSNLRHWCNRGMITTNEWKEFEKIGAVFLPCAGYLDTGSQSQYYTEGIAYWSSTPGHDRDAFYIGNCFGGFRYDKTTSRCDRLAIRLVQDVE